MSGEQGNRFGHEVFAPLAVARRSGLDESLHHGAGVVVDVDGAIVAEIGDRSTIVYPRSALKMFQAAAMVGVGLDVPPAWLALVCASHSGEQRHLDGVVAMLEHHGLSVADLQNTPTLPYGEAANAAAVLARAAPSPLFQNCSGKHAGMLVTCRVNGWASESYLDVDHPLQRRIIASTEALGATVHHVGVDGCGAPTHALSLADAAGALGRLAVADSPVLAAMRAFPEMVGGTDRDVTRWMEHVPGLVVKDGAAGVMVLALTEGDHRGRAAAYKVADGSDLARRAVVPAALRAMGVDVEAAVSSMQAVGVAATVPVLGGGRPVGSIDPLSWR